MPSACPLSATGSSDRMVVARAGRRNNPEQYPTPDVSVSFTNDTRDAGLRLRAGSCHSRDVMVQSTPQTGPFAGVVEQADTRDLKSRASQEACRFKSGLQHHLTRRSVKWLFAEADRGDVNMLHKAMFVQRIADAALLTGWYVVVTVVMGAPAYAAPMSDVTVSDGKQVTVEFTLRLEGRGVVETNVGKKPFTYTHGMSQLMSGLEKGLEGMRVGESGTIVVAPEDGFGEVDDHAYMEVDKAMIPSESLQVGTTVEGRDSTGQPLYPVIHEIREQVVIMDYNHPMAGQTLYFDVKIVDIRDDPMPGAT